MQKKVLVEGPQAYSAEPCISKDNETPRHVSDEGIEYVRTPDDAFEGLAEAGFPWEAHYAIIEGMRMHYVDEGTSEEIVLMLHGQPTWSYLYRKMIPVLTSRGFRVICPDHIGMGRSDKPTKLTEHTYGKHVNRLKEFIKTVINPQFATITLFVQDWGSPNGLRVAGDKPDWFRRIVVANGMLPVLPPNINPMSIPTPVNYNCSDKRTTLEMGIERRTKSPCGPDASCFSFWIEFALTNPYWNASDLVDLSAMGSNRSETIFYNSPFPSAIYKSAIRAFPSMVARINEPDFGNTRAWESLQNFSRPFLSLAGERDQSLGSEATQSRLIENIVGARAHNFTHKRFDAGHFIQEEKGEEVAAYVADFIQATAEMTSLPKAGSNFADCFSLGLIILLLVAYLF